MHHYAGPCTRRRRRLRRARLPSRGRRRRRRRGARCSSSWPWLRARRRTWRRACRSRRAYAARRKRRASAQVRRREAGRQGGWFGAHSGCVQHHDVSSPPRPMPAQRATRLPAPRPPQRQKPPPAHRAWRPAARHSLLARRMPSACRLWQLLWCPLQPPSPMSHPLVCLPMPLQPLQWVAGAALRLQLAPCSTPSCPRFAWCAVSWPCLPTASNPACDAAITPRSQPCAPHCYFRSPRCCCGLQCLRWGRLR